MTNNTVFSQIIKMIPLNKFNDLARQYDCGIKLRKANRWSQFVALGMSQLSRRSSIRDIVENMKAQYKKLHHMGCRIIPRTTFCRINENLSYRFYEDLCGELLSKCQPHTPKHKFRFHNKLYSLDSSTIDLCLSMFPWADFRTTKGAVKLHVGLDHDGYIPSFVSITEGKTADIVAGRAIKFPKNSIIVYDRGYNDYSWFNNLTENKIFFVTRLKTNAKYKITQRRKSPRKGITCDQSNN